VPAWTLGRVIQLCCLVCQEQFRIIIFFVTRVLLLGVQEGGEGSQKVGLAGLHANVAPTIPPQRW
jgi:hypothetical protein